MDVVKATINDAKEIMDLINEAYNNNGSEKWINRDLCPRISCLEQVKDMIPNAYITRHDASKEITGVVVAKLCDDDVVYIGPFATRPKFQNSGVGSKLLSFVENLGKISKLDTYDVTTEVKYYKNRGYEEISRHYIVNLESSYDKDFLKKPGLQSVFMEKKIIKTDEV